MNTVERRAVAALWGIPGVGPSGIAALARQLRWADIFHRPIEAWWNQSKVAHVSLPRDSTQSLEAIADRLDARLAREGYRCTFRGDPEYPSALAEVRSAPPVLFFLGPGAVVPRRRVAIVGSRTPDTGFAPWVRDFAAKIAVQGLTIVSGLAQGVDTAAHLGAIDVGGETWAFLGSSIDQIDPAPKAQLEAFGKAGGTVFSEYPPGVRADETTFVRRNRLISGSSDVVVVARADAQSGALHTARYARSQKRLVMAVPGDPANPMAAGCLSLLKDGAKLCVTAQDAVEAAGARFTRQPELKASPTVEVTDLFERQVLASLTKAAQPFDVIVGTLGADSGRVSAALMSLELNGWVVQKPGRCYEKVQ